MQGQQKKRCVSKKETKGAGGKTRKEEIRLGDRGQGKEGNDLTKLGTEESVGL